MVRNLTIGTHDGTFHCDEALACFMLKQLPEYKEAKIVRSRDLAVLDKCDIVVDIGGKYDVQKHRYDHHMREFTETFDTVVNDQKYKSDIKLSSAGLIYCHFGKRVIQNLLPELKDEKDIHTVFIKVYDVFLKEVDAIDNGVPMFDGASKYRIRTDISSRVQNLNPAWNNKELQPDDQFLKAVALTGEGFVDAVKWTYECWWPARLFVQEAIEKRFEVDPSGEIMELAAPVPWKEHFFELEEELKIEPKLKFIIFYVRSYMVQGIPVEPGSFICRVFLAEPWGGLRDEELSKKSGIDGCVFVHANRFIGGNETREGALEMARKSLAMDKAENK